MPMGCYGAVDGLRRSAFLGEIKSMDVRFLLFLFSGLGLIVCIEMLRKASLRSRDTLPSAGRKGRFKRIIVWRHRKCPYCQNSIVPFKGLVLCEKCKAIHHTECWAALGTCSVFGCGSNKSIYVV